MSIVKQNKKKKKINFPQTEIDTVNTWNNGNNKVYLRKAARRAKRPSMLTTFIRFLIISSDRQRHGPLGYRRAWQRFTVSISLSTKAVFLVASSWHSRKDVAAIKSRGNRACRTCQTRMLRGSSQRCQQQVMHVGRVNEDVTRMIRGNCCRGI